jgi:SAM-dependent methyltransferase
MVANRKRPSRRALKRIVLRATDRLLQNDRLASFLRVRLSHAPLDGLFPRGHYYSPLPDIERAGTQADVLYGPDAALPIDHRIDVAAQARLLAKLMPFLPEYLERFHPGESGVDEAEYAGYLLDGFILSGLLRQLRPARLIEVGCGYSSAVSLWTRELSGAPGQVTLIDPKPEPLLRWTGEAALCRSGTLLVTEEVQAVPPGFFEALEPGDILFIDSSHVVKYGSDVHHLLFKVLPLLRPGVIVHFHDIFWPFEYPLEWVKRGCAWNEAYLVRGLLQFGGLFEIVLFNHYLESRRPDLLEPLPPWLRKSSGSLWLRVLAGPRPPAPAQARPR